MSINIHILIPRRKPARNNPQWLTDTARWIGLQRKRIEHFARLRRTGLHFRAAFWCAVNHR